MPAPSIPEFRAEYQGHHVAINFVPRGDVYKISVAQYRPIITVDGIELAKETLDEIYGRGEAHIAKDDVDVLIDRGFSEFIKKSMIDASSKFRSSINSAVRESVVSELLLSEDYKFRVSNVLVGGSRVEGITTAKDEMSAVRNVVSREAKARRIDISYAIAQAKNAKGYKVEKIEDLNLSKPSGEDRKFPDSSQGAKSALAAMSNLAGIESARVRRDPSVQGVWELSNEGMWRAIVYLAGYPDPFGKVRQMNDFEVAE